MPPAEKVRRQMLEGIPIIPVIGVLVQYFKDNIRATLNPKPEVESMFVNSVGSPLGLYLFIIY